MLYDPQLEVYKDTEGYAHDNALEAWRKVWPDTVCYIKDGVPQMEYTWADTYKGNGGSISNYAAQTNGDHFILSVSGTATSGKIIVFPAIEKAGILFAENIVVNGTHDNNNVHFGFANTDSEGKTIIYGNVAGGSSGWAYCLPPGSTRGSIDILQNELSAGSCPRLGIYCNNYYGFSGTMQIRNLYFVPN